MRDLLLFGGLKSVAVQEAETYLPTSCGTQPGAETQPELMGKGMEFLASSSSWYDEMKPGRYAAWLVERLLLLGFLSWYRTRSL